MKFDELDLRIFNIFVQNNNIKFTTTDIAKKLFSLKNRNDTIKKTTQIDYRLKKLLKSSILNCDIEDRIKRYYLNHNNIICGDSFLTINGINIEMGEAIVIELEDKSYLIKFLDEV